MRPNSRSDKRGRRSQAPFPYEPNMYGEISRSYGPCRKHGPTSSCRQRSEMRGTLRGMKLRSKSSVTWIRDCFTSLVMASGALSIRLTVIARSEATKQSHCLKISHRKFAIKD